MPPTTPISDLCKVRSALFHLVDKSQGPLIIMGDCNLLDTDWYSKRPTNTGNVKNSIFANFGTQTGLIQHVLSSTRGSNVLDLVFSTPNVAITNMSILSSPSSCDHSAITFDLLSNQSKRQIKN